MQKEPGEGECGVSMAHQQEVIASRIQDAMLSDDTAKRVCRSVLHDVIQSDAWGHFLGEFLYNLPSRQGRTLSEVGLAKARKSHCREDIDIYEKQVAEESCIPYCDRDYADHYLLAGTGHS